ncbi:MAG: murein biosynthesis integral membrane protein MurJ [Cytophagales bacterium]|nr:murein biosynthesis integral membrane protein MurJ [Cytophagales bacterium]
MSLLRSASTVSLFTLASRVTGLIRDTLFAAAYGVSPLTDAFYVAFRIPNLFRRVLGEGAFSQAFVPVLSNCRAEEGDLGAKQLIDNVATLLVWLLVVLCVAGVVGAPVLVWVMASGLQKASSSFDAAVVMTRWMFPYIGFMSLVAMSGGILNTWRKFAIPAASPVLLNVALILAIVVGSPLFKRLGIEPIYAQCVGVMLGGILQLAIQIPALRRLGLLPRIGASMAALRTAWTNPITRKIPTLMLPALLGVSVAHISLVINTQIASHLQPGSVSWINHADRLMEFPTAMLGVALGVVLMPRLAAARGSQNQLAYSNMLDWGLRLVVLLSVPCAVALFVFAKPLVAVLFHYGEFSVLDVQQTSRALGSYGLGVLGLVAIKVLASGYYAKYDMKTPMQIAIAVLVCTQVLNYFLVPVMQHAALTLSISIGALLNALWLLAGLIRRGSYTPAAGWFKLMIQVFIASALLGCALYYFANNLPWLEWRTMPHGLGLRALALAGIVAGSAVVYFAMLALMGLNFKALLKTKTI